MARPGKHLIVYRDAVPLFTRVILADTFVSRLRGLQAQSAPGADDGLLLTPCRSIHTMAMRFAIDVLFLDRNGVLVGLAPDVVPWRTAGATGACHTLEVQAGSVRRLALRTGQQLRWELSAQPH